MSLSGAVHGGELHDASHAHRGLVPHATAGALLLARGHNETYIRGGIYLIAATPQCNSHCRPLNRLHPNTMQRRPTLW